MRSRRSSAFHCKTKHVAAQASTQKQANAWDAHGLFDSYSRYVLCHCIPAMSMFCAPKT